MFEILGYQFVIFQGSKGQKVGHSGSGSGGASDDGHNGRGGSGGDDEDSNLGFYLNGLFKKNFELDKLLVPD